MAKPSLAALHADQQISKAHFSPGTAGAFSILPDGELEWLPSTVGLA